MEPDRILVHYTTPNNALKCLEEGLKPLDQIKGAPENMGVHLSLCPEVISFFWSKYPPRLAGYAAILVDDKYTELVDEFTTPTGLRHPVYEGCIPPEDIVGVAAEKGMMTPKQSFLSRLSNRIERAFHQTRFSLPHNEENLSVYEFLRANTDKPVFCYEEGEPLDYR